MNVEWISNARRQMQKDRCVAWRQITEGYSCTRSAVDICINPTMSFGDHRKKKMPTSIFNAPCQINSRDVARKILAEVLRIRARPCAKLVATEDQPSLKKELLGLLVTKCEEASEC